jgi:hypothetical protein
MKFAALAIELSAELRTRTALLWLRAPLISGSKAHESALREF